MNRHTLQALLEEVRNHGTSVEQAMGRLERFPTDPLGYANVDTHRALRTGLPEAIYGEGKTTEQLVAILGHIHQAGHQALATRVAADKAEVVLKAHPAAQWHPVARVITLAAEEPESVATLGPVAVVCAGTSDLPVAEEAAVVAEACGNEVRRFNDVGVSGIHRLFGAMDDIKSSRVIVVVAGMEGALASVVAGLVDQPVIAVPTSVGYGANLGGVTTLLAMLNSCAPGVSVVNIDNGYGAAVQASLINRVR